MYRLWDSSSWEVQHVFHNSSSFLESVCISVLQMQSAGFHYLLTGFEDIWDNCHSGSKDKFRCLLHAQIQKCVVLLPPLIARVHPFIVPCISKQPTNFQSLFLRWTREVNPVDLWNLQSRVQDFQYFDSDAAEVFKTAVLMSYSLKKHAQLGVTNT